MASTPSSGNGHIVVESLMKNYSALPSLTLPTTSNTMHVTPQRASFPITFVQDSWWLIRKKEAQAKARQADAAQERAETAAADILPADPPHAAPQQERAETTTDGMHPTDSPRAAPDNPLRGPLFSQLYGTNTNLVVPATSWRPGDGVSG